VDSPHEIRFAMTARILARERRSGMRQHSELAEMSKRKLLQYQGAEGERRMEMMVDYFTKNPPEEEADMLRAERAPLHFVERAMLHEADRPEDIKLLRKKAKLRWWEPDEEPWERKKRAYFHEPSLPVRELEVQAYSKQRLRGPDHTRRYAERLQLTPGSLGPRPRAPVRKLL